MKKLSRIFEQVRDKNATIILTVGRFNPPTTAHSMMLDKLFKLPGVHHVLVSHSQDSKKNPLSAEEKIDLLHKIYPNNKGAFHAMTKDFPTIFHHASKLYKEGYRNLHLIVGGDRVPEFKQNLEKYNGYFDDKGNGYKFDKITVTSAGERDPDADGETGMSASKMRKHAVDWNVKEFTKGLHPAIADHAPTIMNKIRKAMGHDQINEQADLIRKRYKDGDLYNVGDVVECKDGKTGEIINLGTNYLTLVNEGVTFKRWLTDISTVSENKIKRDQLYRESFIFKGYKTKTFDRTLSETFQKLTLENDDHYGILNFIKSCDSLNGLTKEISLSDVQNTISLFEQVQRYSNKFNLKIEKLNLVEDWLIEASLLQNLKFTPTDKYKVASLIAVTLNVKPISTLPDVIVNQAAKQARMSNYSKDGWTMMGKLFNMASSCGIKWDKEIFSPSARRYMVLV
jgi:hypothetical protein